jgi:hypothetical protein
MLNGVRRASGALLAPLVTPLLLSTSHMCTYATRPGPAQAHSRADRRVARQPVS